MIATVHETSPDAVLEAFPSDTSKASLEKAFEDIKAHERFAGLKAEVAIYSVKHSSKKPFLEETREEFESSLEEYVGGAFTFAQESVKRFYADHGEKALADGGEKKGVSLSLANWMPGHGANGGYLDADLHGYAGSVAVQRAVRRVRRSSRFRAAAGADAGARAQREGRARRAHDC